MQGRYASLCVQPKIASVGGAALAQDRLPCGGLVGVPDQVAERVACGKTPAPEFAAVPRDGGRMLTEPGITLACVGHALLKGEPCHLGALIDGNAEPALGDQQ